MILITAWGDVIGSAVVRHIIEKKDESVVNFDCLTCAGNPDSLASIAENVRYNFVQADICDLQRISDIFAKYQPDAVMHLAAESHVDRSIDGPADFVCTNIIGTFTLLEASRHYWSLLSCDKKTAFRFHHISTDEVYGDLENTVDLFTESKPYSPIVPYSASKASSAHLVRAWNRTYGLPVIVTNCSNNYDPYHLPEKLNPHIISNVSPAKPLPVYNDCSQIRDWLYVEDHARAFYKVLTEVKVGETYNIGGHNEKKDIELVETLCSILDELKPVANNPAFSSASSPMTHYKELITLVTHSPGHDVSYAIDASKIARELGWSPEESFETGIR